ncbi:MAG: rhodanese [Cytophagaceae bacterium]|nr:rhodanese [Cytophagaceae bacterium]|tara:strand:+ start:9266 stop:9730 length:465 start_codon:yes stop_codon:yes gene_type:complete
MIACIAKILTRPHLEKVLKKQLTPDLPTIKARELDEQKSECILLDTRSKKEYDVSHIDGAIWVNETFDPQKIAAIIPDKNAKIIVYCTIGIRSDCYGIALKKAGYTQVKNLYGSIFSWKNAGFPVVDAQGRPTQKVHVYSRVWSRYLVHGKKVY